MRLIALLLLVLVAPAHAVVVSGTITRLADGLPADGADVRLVQQTTPFTQVELGQVTVGAAGTYSFSFPNTGSFYIRVALPPLLPREVSFSFQAATPPQVIDVALSAPSSITAEVRDAATQQPLAGVAVSFYELPNTFPATVVTDAQGRATRNGASGGNYRICVISLEDAYIDECQDSQQLPLDGDVSGVFPTAIGSGVTVDVPIALDAGATISGVVSDRYFGGAAAGEIRFQFYDTAGNNLDATARVLGSGGGYALAGLPAGTYRLAASGLGANYYTRRVYPDIDCPNSCTITAGTAITVSGQQIAGNIDFALHPGAVVRGTIRDADTLAPIAGATVRVYRDIVFPPAWNEVTRTQTAPDGTFTLARISAATYRLAASASGYFALAYPATPCYFETCGIGATQPIALDEEVTGRDLSLTRGGTIGGSIIGDETGLPLNGDVIVQQVGGSIRFNLLAPDGTFETYGLPPGNYHAAARRVRNGAFDCELYQAQACNPTGDPINPAVATAIAVGTTAVQGIQFTLPNGELLSDGFE